MDATSSQSNLNSTSSNASHGMQTPRAPSSICTPSPHDTRAMATVPFDSRPHLVPDSQDQRFSTAVQTLSICYQEFQLLLRSYQAEKASRIKDQNEFNEKFSDLKLQYLKLQTARCADFRSNLEEQQKLKDTLEIKVHQATEELATIGERKNQELALRDKTITELRERIDKNEALLFQSNDKIKSMEEFAKTIDDLEAEKAILESKNISAAALIKRSEQDIQELKVALDERWATVEKECASCTQLAIVKKELLCHYPGLNDSLDNITEVLNADEGTSKRKRRKYNKT